MNRVIGCAILAVSSCGGAMAEGKQLYRARLEEQAGREVVVTAASGQRLEIGLTGFGAKLQFGVDGGGVNLCRTILKHHSERAKVVLSLPIPNPRGRCRMLPGELTVEGASPPVALRSATLVKISGQDRRLRAIVGKLYGEIE